MYYPVTLLNSMIASEWNTQPSSVKSLCTAGTAFHSRELMRIIKGRYDFTLPGNAEGQKAWRMNWWRELLFGYGSLAIFYTRRNGWLPLAYGVERLDEQYNPLVIRSIGVTEDTMDIRGIVGVNCCIVQAFDDYYGYYDIVTHYATMLANIDKGIEVNQMITSVGLYAEADSPKDAQDIKRAFSEATTGKPLVVEVAKKGGAAREYKTFFNKPKDSYLVGEYLNARATVINQFLTSVGINNANTDKKERLVTDEVNSNNDLISITGDYVLDNIRRGLEDARKLTGLNMLAVKKHGEEGDTDERNNADRVLPVR